MMTSILDLTFGKLYHFDAICALPFGELTWRVPLHDRLSRVLNSWGDDTFEFIRKDAPRVVAILLVTFVLLRLLKLFSRHLVDFTRRGTLPGTLRTQQLTTLSSVIYSVGTSIILFLATMQVLSTFGIEVKPLLASAGILGLAVGFGAQTLVHDVINGFFILLENWFDVGDTVRIGTVQGAVESLTLRRTTLRDADGSVHIIPNSQITILSNLTRDWTQVALHVSVDYKEDSDRIVELLKQAAGEVYRDERFREAIVAEPQVPGIDRVSGSEVDYVLLVKTRPGKQFDVTREFRRRVKDCFEKNGIKPGGQNRFYLVESSTPAQPK